MIVRSARTLEETEEVARALARCLSSAIHDGRLEGVLIGLSGELGAGKTAFTRAFVEAIDPRRAAEVCSPTYPIVLDYQGEPPIRHLDLYRIDSRRDLEDLGWRDLYFGRGFTLVEWIERVPDAIPADWLEVRFWVSEDGARTISFLPHGLPIEGCLASGSM